MGMALANRGKRSMAIDLKQPQGRRYHQLLKPRRLSHQYAARGAAALG